MGVGADPLVSDGRAAPALDFAPMVAADLPQVMEIERLLVSRSPWTPGLFLHELKLAVLAPAPGAHAPTARGALLGYVCWWLVGDEVHILNLAVHPDRARQRRRAGAGAARSSTTRSRTAPCSVSLEVRPRATTAALALYRACGFTQIGVRAQLLRPRAGRDHHGAPARSGSARDSVEHGRAAPRRLASPLSSARPRIDPHPWNRLP